MDSRLGTCEMCSKSTAKYTCPGCEINTCSVQCVKEHKESYGCDGKRNKTAYKPLSKFTDLDLKNDYGMLEEIANSVDSFSRDPAKKKGSKPCDIPKFLCYLREAAHKREMKLWFMPAHFTRRKINRSFHDYKTKRIEWTVQFLFHKLDGEVKSMMENKVIETDLLGDVILKYLNKWNESWVAEYKVDNLNQCQVLLQAENIKDARSRFFKLNPGKSIEENLKGHTIVEFPIFVIVFKESLHKYSILTQDQAKKELADMMEAAKQKREALEKVEGEDVFVDEATDESSSRKRARLDGPIDQSQLVSKMIESDEEMDVGDNFFNL